MKDSPFSYFLSPVEHQVIASRLADRLAQRLGYECLHYVNRKSGRNVVCRITKQASANKPQKILDLIAWDPKTELAPGVSEIRYRLLNQQSQMDKMRRALDARSKQRKQSRIDQIEARKDYGKFLKRAVVRQGVHNDPKIQEWVDGKRGFVPTTPEQKEQFDSIISQMAKKAKPSVLINGAKNAGK